MITVPDACVGPLRSSHQQLGVFAEFETNLCCERQTEGIAKTTAAGVYKGQKPSIDVGIVHELREGGLGPPAMAKQLKIGKVWCIAFSRRKGFVVQHIDRCNGALDV